MAVGTVCSEPVSRPKSLIYWEDTGNRSSRGASGEATSVIESLFGVPLGVFPDFGNREFPTDEQGLP